MRYFLYSYKYYYYFEIINFLSKIRLDRIFNLTSLIFMRENLISDNIQYDEFSQNKEENDYKNLITRLKEIKITISLLEKSLIR